MDTLKHIYQRFTLYLPAVFFVGGFLWDALTIGRRVQASDLWVFATYWLGAALLVVLISRPRYILADKTRLPEVLQKLFPSWLPYFALQFLFGSLLSPLFILYFQSSGTALSWLLALGLALLLVLNEFLEDHYRKFTLVWAMFGLCSILLLNFALPFLLGSISAWWFYLSTLLGLGLLVILNRYSPRELGSMVPVYVLTAVLVLAYAADMIPPVPLVKRDIQIAYAVEKQGGHYVLTQQAAPWWRFWQSHTDTMAQAERIYCFSSVFAPSGLQTRLQHQWQRHTKTGWHTESVAGFGLNGGRDGGYRGYTFKSNPQAGDWRVRLVTTSEKTLAVHYFSVRAGGEVTQVVNAY